MIIIYTIESNLLNSFKTTKIKLDKSQNPKIRKQNEQLQNIVYTF